MKITVLGAVLFVVAVIATIYLLRYFATERSRENLPKE